MPQGVATAAGIPEPQAKAIAKTQVATTREAAKESSKDLATKGDLAQLELRLEKSMAELKADMMRFSIIVALGTLTLQTGLIAILLMLFLNRPGG